MIISSLISLTIAEISMTKIQRVSRFFRVLFQIGFVSLPIILIINWMFGPISLGNSRASISMSLYPHEITALFPITPAIRLQGFFVSLIPTLILMALQYYLIKLFYCYERGEIFSIRTVTYIRNIGVVLLAQVIFQIIYVILMNLVLNGTNISNINFSSVNLSVLLLALMIILNSWITAEGFKLHQEDQLTI